MGKKVNLTSDEMMTCGKVMEDVGSISLLAKRHLAVTLLLSTIPEEQMYREGLLGTPDRVAHMYEEIFSGYTANAEEILSTGFEEENHQELVLLKDIPFYSHCEHHMVPFFGKVHIAYIPQGRVVGISKLARLVECYARRLQIQERLSSDIADSIQYYLNPKGVAVVIEAEHLCMTMRGVQKPGAKTVTSAMRGVFKDNTNNARMELMNLIKL